MKFLWIFLTIFCIVNIKFTQSTSLLQNNLNKLKNGEISTVKCPTNNDLNFTTPTNISQVIFFESCHPLTTLTNPKLSSTINDLKFLSIIKFEVNLRVKNFTNSEISLINSNLANKIKKPLLISIQNKLTDTEILYEINEGHMQEATRVTQFLSTFNDGSTAYSDVIQNNCALCLRIASMTDGNFSSNLKLNDDDGKCDIDCIRALLMLPCDDKLEEIPKKVFNNFHNFYVIKLKALTNKLNDESDLKMNLEALASMAWRNKEFKIFEFLIRADFPFPQNFIADREKKISTRNKFYIKVEKYIESINQFHEDIKDGNVEEVKKFLKAHKFLRFARDIENKSAIQVAFENEKFEILSILKGHGMSVGNVNELAEQQNNLKDVKEETKLKIRQFNHDQLVDIKNDYISELFHRSSIYFDSKSFSKEKLMKVIYEAYVEVNQSFPEILEISSKCKSLEIIFNFESDMVDDYDPSGKALGITSWEHNYLIIGSFHLLSNDDLKRNDALGTIAHEFMHFVMYLLYDNNVNPYEADDIETIEWFMNVTEKCKIKMEEETSIENAFNYKDEVGDGKVYHSELIARVPDMVMGYKHNQTHVHYIKEVYFELFEFYNKKILSDMIEMNPKMEVKYAVREFNQWFNVVENFDKLKVCGKEDFQPEDQTPMEKILSSLNLNPSEDIHFIITNSVTLTLKKIQQEVKIHKIPTIFTKLSFADHNNFVKVLYDIDNLKTEIILVVLCDDYDKTLIFNNMIESSSFEQVIFVGDSATSDGIPNLNFAFNDLCEESQKILLKHQINFQGVEIFFKEFIKDFDDEIYNLIDLETLIKFVPQIGNDLIENKEYFIKVKLVDENGNLKDLEDFFKNNLKFNLIEEIDSSENEIENDAIAKKSSKLKYQKHYFEEARIKIKNHVIKKVNFTTEVPSTTFLSNVEIFNYFTSQVSENYKLDSEIFIISSPAGFGKSTAIKEIALRIKNESPSKWIIFINFESFNLTKNYTDDEVIELLTQSEEESDQKMLRKFLEHPQKVTIIFDSFDKAENHQIALNFMDRCRKFASQFWISTRPHYQSFLTKKFKNSKVFKIFPMNHKRRENFLEYFSHLNETQEEKLIKFVEEIEVDNVQLMHEIVENWSENFYEIFSKILLKRFNNFKIKFFDNFEENLTFKSRLHKEHQKIALKSLELKETAGLKIMKQNFTIDMQEIYKFGLIYQKNNQKIFPKAFHQFYVAQFLIEAVNSKSEHFEVVQKLMIEIIKEEEKFSMIVKFLEDFMDQNNDKKDIKELIKLIRN